jgi:hypothetical protein
MLKRSHPLKAVFKLALGLIFLTGCATEHRRPLPYKAWELTFFGPAYMEAWIETADVVDINNRLFRGAGSGGVTTGYPRAFSKGIPEKFYGQPEGWPKHSFGSGRYVTGADLPRRVYVRWQSMAEPQTYEALVEIPESARTAMLQGNETFCRVGRKWITDYRDILIVGLAPGGVVKVWLGGQCTLPTEVIRVQGRINPEGPYDGQSNGKHRPLSEESKAYIEKFGIPYGSW